MNIASRIIIAIALVAVATILDRPVARYVRESGLESFVRSHSAVRVPLKLPGDFRTTVIAAAVVALVHRNRIRGGLIFLCTSAGGGINFLLKWMIGRLRPFKEPGDMLDPFALHPFRHGISGLLKQTNLSFPSGHSCLAFATAAALDMLFPASRLKWLWYAIACVTALERIAENAHWVSDTVGAAVIGIAAARLIAIPLRKYLDRTGSTTT